jgi:predicted GNAT superfamily acetyltransferase
VCIERSARGAGILSGLYAELKRLAASRYGYCVLFISEGNKRSFNAHLKLGMKPLGMFEFNKSQFYILGAAL